LDPVGITEAQDGNAKGGKISHFPVLDVVLIEKGCGFVKLSTVGDTKAEVIQPYPIRAKTVMREGLARIPRVV
jgi:hypothetical protein